MDELLPQRSSTDQFSVLDSNLNACIGTLLYLQQEVRRAHWNIKGPSFYSIHLLLDSMKGDLEDLHDSIAERAVGLGITVLAIPINIPQGSPYMASGAFPEAAMLGEIVRLYRETQHILQSSVDSLSSDYVTIDIITTVASTLASHEYKLRSHWTT